MSEDRKKRLEEIKRKKAEMERQLKEANANAPAAEASTPFSTEASSTQSNPASAAPSNFASERRRPTIKKQRPSRIFEDPEKNKALLKIQLKKLNKLLKTESFTEFCQGVYPQLEESQTQYELPKEFEDQKKHDAHRKSSDRKDTAQAKRSSVASANIDLAKALARKEEPNEIDLQVLKVKEVSEDSRNEMLKKYEQKVQEFFDKDKDLFDEALTSNDIFDICGNYYNEDEKNLDLSRKTMATFMCEIFDDNSNGRSVIALDWSQKHPDLLLASFSKPSESDFNKSNGLVQLWSYTNTKCPVYVINYQTQITSAVFHNQNPNVILGGSYMGQLLMWDIKNKPTPVQKSRIGGSDEVQTHNMPITCLAVLGGDGGGSGAKIVSVSNDGVLCEWSLRDLSQPIARMKLTDVKEGGDEKFSELGALSIGYNPLSPQSILIGTDNCNIYQINLEEPDPKSQIINKFQGNGGPVFSVDMHPTNQEGGSSYSDLFLASSADWTSKLYSTSLTLRQNKHHYIFLPTLHYIPPKFNSKTSPNIR